MYYDLLPKLKNATMARKDKITVPFSKMDFAVLTALAASGYIKSVEKESVGRKPVATIRLANSEKKTATLDFKLVSKPSRHRYMDYRSLRPVRQGHGLGMLSTSKGVMTDREARKAKVGGEYLFEIW